MEQGPVKFGLALRARGICRQATIFRAVEPSHAWQNNEDKLIVRGPIGSIYILQRTENHIRFLQVSR